MPILVECPCGKKFRVFDEHGGKRIKCPGCDQGVRVPGPALAPATPQIIAPEHASIFIPNLDLAELPPPPKRPFWKDPVIVFGAAGPTIVLALFFGYLYREHTDKANRAYIAAQRAEADRLFREGNIELALPTYLVVRAWAGRIDPGDRESLAHIDAAQQSIDRLEPIVAERRHQRIRAEWLSTASRLDATSRDTLGETFRAMREAMAGETYDRFMEDMSFLIEVCNTAGGPNISIMDGLDAEEVHVTAESLRARDRTNGIERSHLLDKSHPDYGGMLLLTLLKRANKKIVPGAGLGPWFDSLTRNEREAHLLVKLTGGVSARYVERFVDDGYGGEAASLTRLLKNDIGTIASRAVAEAIGEMMPFIRPGARPHPAWQGSPDDRDDLFERLNARLEPLGKEFDREVSHYFYKRWTVEGEAFWR